MIFENAEMEIKYILFLLLSEKIIINSSILYESLSEDTRNSIESIIELCDEGLNNIFVKSRIKSLPQALELICTHIDAQAKVIGTTNKSASAVLKKISEELSGCGEWSAPEFVKKNFEKAEFLSKTFYKSSSQELTKMRLASSGKLSLRFRFEHLSPVSYEAASNLVIVSFSYQQGLVVPLSYPFAFFHEYSSHIHGANSGSELFDDGWMIFAIQKFINSQRFVLSADLQYCDLVINVINSSYPHFLSPIPQRGYSVARKLYNLDQSLFWTITFELAGFSIIETRPYFHSEFINKLDKSLKNPQKETNLLKESIEKADNILDRFKAL